MPLNPNHFGRLAVWCFLIASGSALAQGNLVVNGGFDGSGTGWSITNTPGGFGFQYSLGAPGGSILLDNIDPSADSDPTASQTIRGFTPGKTYVVSGDYLTGKDRGEGSYTNASFGVAIDDRFYFEAMGTHDFIWRSFAFLHTAASSNAVLSLSSQIHGTGVSFTIDNIVVQPLPELTASVADGHTTLSWPTAAKGFTLQTTTNLVGTSGWLTVTNAVVVSGTNRTVTIKNASPNQWFRLGR